MASNEQFFESLNDESLNINDLSLNRKRNGNGVSETVKTRKSEKMARRECRSVSPHFLRHHQYGSGLSSKDSE